MIIKGEVLRGFPPLFKVDDNGVLISYNHNNSFSKTVKIPEGVTAIGQGVFASSIFNSIIIPEGVTIIHRLAFSWCKELESVVIPSTVTTIQEKAFINCPKLKFTVSKSSKFYCAEKGALFTKDKKTLIACFNSSPSAVFDLPKETEYIADNAFGFNDTIEKINLPKGLLSIGAEAFGFCENLKEITIPQSVISIGTSAFEYCKNVKIEIEKGNPKYTEKNGIIFLLMKKN